VTYHPCVKRPTELEYLVLNAQVGDVLTHKCQQSLDRGMRWYSSEEGHNFWREFYREERAWTLYASQRLQFYLGRQEPTPPPEEDIWL
jgi:hypothetical protein